MQEKIFVINWDCMQSERKGKSQRMSYYRARDEIGGVEMDEQER